jgi:genome maintenance exonuclease 1
VTFEHYNIGEFKDISSVTTENGRYYTTPEGNVYPSVTTVLGKMSDKKWLDDWKQRVGEDESKKILVQAGKRGTAFHDLAEQYLRNNAFYTKGHMPVNIFSFNKIKPILDKNIEKVGALEVPLYSDKLRIAGRTDCLALWNGKWSVVDFKTSRRVKSKEDILNYFYQASCYSYMVYERLNFMLPQIVIVMDVDGSEPIVFIEKMKNYIFDFIEKRKKLDI